MSSLLIIAFISKDSKYTKFVLIFRNSAKDHKFIWKERNSFGKEQNKGEVSVEQYFRLKYGVKLNYPQLPCLEVGSATNKVYIPLELCKVVSHQRLRRSLTNKERADMTTIAGSQTPKERLKQCQQFVSKQFNSGETANQNKPFLYEFGIDVSQQLLEVQSKVIEPPKLKYSGNKSVVPQHGEWEMYKTGSTFLRAARFALNLIFH
jgi:eukaryotic translation initiation factor 2C